ncbi:unannotated protein [freshwater metagenome]|uniref:Unannotated protein n=1 Tax=freshwater metagenome TaxID=449393 RepID=A0A6J6Q1C3_9ZZZZ
MREIGHETADLFRRQPLGQSWRPLHRAEVAAAHTGLWSHHVHVDAERTTLDCKRSAQAHDTKFHAAIHRHVGEADKARTAGHVDDATVSLRRHVRPRRTGDVHGAEHVGVGHRPTELVAQIRHWRLAYNTGVVDDDVDAAEGIDSGLHHARLRVGDRAGVEHRMTASSRDLGHHIERWVGGWRVGHTIGVANANADVIHHNLGAA